MKVLTFFTVRGGSGKTVLSAAFASYVSYILGKRAMVLDFDGPEYNLYNMRLRELSLMKEGDAECDRDGLYIVEKVENTDSDSLDRFAESIRRIKEQFDYIVSRAVTDMPTFVGWVRGMVRKGQQGTLPNGILYLKGGDLTEELAATRMKWREYNISDFFEEEFFETKKVVYTQK